MEEQIVKAVASLLQPAANEGAKKLFQFDSGKAGEALTEALIANLAEVIKDADPSEIAQRMMAREHQIKLRKQFNFEHVASLAIDLASARPPETRRQVEEDWFLRWYEAAEQISDSTVQMLWAKAFDQQANKNQRKISLRAIETLRLMERDDVINFRRAADIFECLGVVTLSSERVLQSIMGHHELDSLLDQNLLTIDQYQLSNIAVPGGFSVYFKLPEGVKALDPIKQCRLSARARELSATIPDSVVFDKVEDGQFDVGDPFLRAHYINIFADGLDSRYEISLSIHSYDGRRSPPGGLKKTHLWEHDERKWVRIADPQSKICPDLLLAFEEGYGANW